MAIDYSDYIVQDPTHPSGGHHTPDLPVCLQQLLGHDRRPRGSSERVL